MKIKEKEKDEGSSPQPEKVFYDNRIKRKNVLALNEKVAAIREYEKMPVYKRIGRMFHCSPDQIKRIVQQKDNILKAWEQRTRRCQDAKTLELKVVRVSMLGKAVYDWIRRMMYYKDFMITDGLIQKMALQFKSAMGLQNFFPHQEWCDKFRHTYKITVNDSKMLNIGYTQGYSVQIKDVMKDVLSECTPDGEAADHFDGRLDNDDNGDAHSMADSESDKDGDNTDNQDSKDNILPVKAFGLQSQSPSQTQSQSQNKHYQRTSIHQQQQQSQSIRMPQLQSIRQLVALPIKTNSGMTQKVLVATPITPANVQRAGGGSSMSNVGGGGSGGGGAGGGGGTPMTMTIIPFTTLAQAQTQNVAQAVTIGAAANSDASKRVAQTLVSSSSSERQIMPSPMLDIKTEIKQEPEDIEIKQEYISEDEEQDVPETNSSTATTAIAAAAAAAAELPEGAAVKVNLSQAKNRLAGLDDASIIDDDNMALASLRQLMRQPMTTTGNPTTRTARTKQMTLRGSNTEQPSTKTPTTEIPTTTFTLRTPSASSTSTSTSTTTTTSSSVATAVRAGQKRNRHGNATPALPPIQTCSEARRYLKLLEDFALYKENFRLIGLITRADEVLRELDGDNDVDID